MVDQLCLGASIADLLGILCLFRAGGRPTLLGESVADLLEILYLFRADGETNFARGEYC